MFRIAFLTAGLLFMMVEVWAQGTDYPLNSPAYDILESYRMQSPVTFFTKVKPYARKKGLALLEALEESDESENAKYIQLESREYLNDSLFGLVKRPFWGRFYRYESDLISTHSSSLDLHVNPVIQWDVGVDSELGSPLYTNTRGIEFRGTIDQKLSFYSSIHENQVRLPSYVQSVQDSVGVIPLEGFWKSFGEDGYDFLRARGYLDFNVSPHVSAQFGFGNHFIGDGIRSLILSDFSNAYTYLKVDLEVWKFRYTNIFAEMIGDVFFFEGGTLGSRAYPKKYFALHHLDLAITPNLHVGLFESVLTGQPDSLGGADFKIQYLNPIIFYGAIEQQDGSADNVIVGTDLNWGINPSLQFYGQFVLDELILDELLSNSGWWGNKYAFQLGLKHYNFLTPNLSWQLEYNQARPFTYAHDGAFTSYTHYRQPLAHPLGANFREVLFVVGYQPAKRLITKANFLLADYGSGPVNGFSIGRDPLINSNNRGINNENDFGNRQGQGIAGDLAITQFLASYQFKHNLFLDLQLMYRLEKREGSPNQSSAIFVTGVRLNIPRRSYLF